MPPHKFAAVIGIDRYVISDKMLTKTEGFLLSCSVCVLFDFVKYRA